MNRIMYEKETKQTHAAHLHGTKRPEMLFRIPVSLSGPEIGYIKSGTGMYVVCAKNGVQAREILRRYLKAHNQNGNIEQAYEMDAYTRCEQALHEELLRELHKEGCSGFAVCPWTSYTKKRTMKGITYDYGEEERQKSYDFRQNEQKPKKKPGMPHRKHPARRDVHGAFGNTENETGGDFFIDGYEAFHDMEGVTYEGCPLNKSYNEEDFER